MVIFSRAQLGLYFRSHTTKLIVGTVLSVFPVFVPALLAYCIENSTENRLYFATVPQKSVETGFEFTKWLDAGQWICRSTDSQSKHDSKIWVSVFSDIDDIEGCGAEVLENGQLKLVKFIQFDRCIWESIPEIEHGR